MQSVLLAAKSATRKVGRGEMRRLQAVASHLRSSSSTTLPPSSIPSSFINRAKNEGLDSLLGAFETTERFDRVLETMNILSITPGKVSVV